jgi:hypothetical protein
MAAFNASEMIAAPSLDSAQVRFGGEMQRFADVLVQTFGVRRY